MFVGALFVVAAFGYFSGRAAFSVFCGAAIASLNLWVLSRSVSNLLSGQSSGWAAAAAFKFVALLALVYLLLQSGAVGTIGLAVGFGALPLGILLAGVFGTPQEPSSLSATRPKNAESDHA